VPRPGRGFAAAAGRNHFGFDRGPSKSTEIESTSSILAIPGGFLKYLQPMI
jgi:hypothetical protein